MKQLEERILLLLGLEGLAAENLRGNMSILPFIWLMQREILRIPIKYVSEYYEVPVREVTVKIYDEYKKIASVKCLNERYKFVRKGLGKPLR